MNCRFVAPSLLAALLLSACGSVAPRVPTPAPEPAPPPAPSVVLIETADASVSDRTPALSIPPVAALLRDGFEQRFAERALPHDRSGQNKPHVVVDKGPGKARIIFDEATERLLFWVEDSGLLETPASVTPLTRNPAKPGPKERVLVGPGAFLTRLRDQAGFVRVSASDQTVAAEGWLPASAIARTYVPATVPAVSGNQRWALARGANLLERPGGPALAKLLDTAPPQVTVDGISTGPAWFVEVAYGSSSLSVRGFVPKSALSEPQSMGWGRKGFGYAAHQDPPSEILTFSTGTCLYDEPWGEVIGVLRLPVSKSVHIETGATSAWRLLDFPRTGAKAWAPREGAQPNQPTGKLTPLSLADGFGCSPAPPR